MFPFTHEYTVFVGDVRKASYFGMIRRNNKAFILMAVVIAAALIYYGSALAAGSAPNMLIFYIAGAYIVWAIIMLANAEKGIRNNVKSAGSPIGKPSSATFTTDSVRIRIPAVSADLTLTIKHLAVVFELAAEYLVYTNAQQVYIIPKRGLSEERQKALRSVFRTRLGERFWTRFEKKK